LIDWDFLGFPLSVFGKLFGGTVGTAADLWTHQKLIILTWNRSAFDQMKTLKELTYILDLKRRK